MIHDRIADHRNEQSLATKLRRRRFRVLLQMLEPLRGRVDILDIGGRQQYWEMMGLDWATQNRLHISLLNPEEQTVTLPNFTSILGDGRCLEQFGDKQFDIVFSNSTIEHVGSIEDQRRMANEVQRVGKQYCVQTPNRYFPIEPHFVFPFFQFLPLSSRVWLVQHLSLGWAPKIDDMATAISIVDSIRLMTRAELEDLFPGSAIFEERFCGLVKSFIAYTPGSLQSLAVEVGQTAGEDGEVRRSHRAS